ncbi:hypothetical protein CASFOL_015202 [Castilleja foliolosa]|uniref:Protein FAR1-RELATED SEQUENCE n=1 Tax=Castilleja foliolosa TaxID=1961234 RepID=A0ABD3DGG2_9LAMI
MQLEEGELGDLEFGEKSAEIGVMKKGEKVFPKARHRLCLWHLYQNAVSHFGKLKGDKVFNDLFNKCMSGCSNEGQFEECWSSMISTYCLQDNSWFRRLYDIREKWSTAFNKDFFSTGTVTSQRSESTNHSIGFKAKPTTSLSEFYNGAFKQAHLLIFTILYCVFCYFQRVLVSGLESIGFWQCVGF